MIELKPIKSNFKKLDSLIGGFFPGELTVIGSRPAIGKTSFLYSLIKQITMDSGTPGLLFSPEMPIDSTYMRMTSSIAKISFFKFRMGKLDEYETICWEKTSRQVKDLPLVINDKPDININELCEEARKLCKKKKVKIIYIDYLGLITTDNENQDFFEQVSFVIKKLKVLARELNIPIVLLCQVSRDAEGNPPGLTQLRGSGEVESVADVILLLHRDRNINEGCSAQLFVAKNHNGPLGTIDFIFYSQIGTFEETV
jgi:replicative DNA helicase